MKTVNIVLLALLFGAISGTVSSLVLFKMQDSTNNRIEDFYITENAVHVSPHSLRIKMSQGINDFVLVDLRSEEEYNKEHIAGAVNIPAYKTKEKSAYDEVDRIVKSFKALPEDRDIIVYCYSMPCMTGGKIGKMLAEKGIYVKLLNIGWNEWRYYWGLWNHEHEWNTTDVMDFVSEGEKPGSPRIDINLESCSVGDFGC